MALIVKYAHVMCLTPLRTLAETLKLNYMMPRHQYKVVYVDRDNYLISTVENKKQHFSSVKNSQGLFPHLSHFLIDSNHFLVGFFA